MFFLERVGLHANFSMQTTFDASRSFFSVNTDINNAVHIAGNAELGTIYISIEKTLYWKNFAQGILNQGK